MKQVTEVIFIVLVILYTIVWIKYKPRLVDEKDGLYLYYRVKGNSENEYKHYKVRIYGV